MAFIQDRDDELQEQTPGQGQSPLVSGQGSSIAGSSGGEAAAQGGGAGNGWTNIQAYLNANKNNSGSAQALSNTVNKRFDDEKNKITSDSGAFLQGAKGQVDAANVSNEKADDLVKQAGQNYTYGAPQNQGYTDLVNQMQTSLNGQYQGPRDYTYGFSSKTQETGSALKDNNPGFDSLMNNVYSQTAGRPLTGGQFQLQKQFDVNNEALANARQNLAGSYDQLGQYRDQTVQDATKQLSGYEQQYRDNQNRLRDYLGYTQNNLTTQQAQKENEARNAYQQTLNDQSGYRSAAEPEIAKYGRMYQDAMAGALARRGIWGDLSWNQLQREQDVLNGTGPDAYRVYYDPSAGLAEHAGALNQFYGEQNAKYADTAADEKRRRNAIMDFLGLDGARQEQGFRVHN
ncbi:MAG: hypothetical protein AB7F86_09650 [Bdellovibrionales bacterium]